MQVESSKGINQFLAFSESVNFHLQWFKGNRFVNLSKWNAFKSISDLSIAKSNNTFSNKYLQFSKYEWNGFPNETSLRFILNEVNDSLVTFHLGKKLLKLLYKLHFMNAHAGHLICVIQREPILTLLYYLKLSSSFDMKSKKILAH